MNATLEGLNKEGQRMEKTYGERWKDAPSSTTAQGSDTTMLITVLALVLPIANS